jgi:hypothetical protein
MGKWATYRRRGGGVVPPVDAPVLAFVPADNLTWTWSGTDPDQWSVEKGPTAVGPWTPWDVTPGAGRAFPGVDTGTWYTIIGVDSGFAPVTTRSNAVDVP